MNINLVYLYLLSPLHTGGATQEGNLLGIARESHTNIPYLPSSTIRGRLRASETDKKKQYKLFGTELKSGEENSGGSTDSNKLVQGDIWIGDGSILWLPVPSLSHGVVWISSPMLLQRWARLNALPSKIPTEYSCSFKQSNTSVYLKDAVLKANDLKEWKNWQEFVPKSAETNNITRLLVIPDRHCETLIQMGLWRQVKVKLDEHKNVSGGFRYEEAIPPDTLVYFPWGITSQANGSRQQSETDFKALLGNNTILQIGGQESLGRGFVQQWLG
ncbi:type III-B CRISPR module RAMP protein Cmr4 [Oscillatoria sp. FACHB-1406]|uniref:type III-B CRISPR module RAMP protein Cmr4 n=1 Tax=Oscillatoria sp. FACHB-1406 TaxID=2692846 RepID=UPI00168611D9|nr:type III-B CRISPR module RAMP protein Cmr4 [Oscillatoria sp. FACHB-1406]MBD2576995.1 type III-B CRISPR module RAMP protein Cmr4 [Oscillatoria sp. FACHB-1406]